MGYGLVLVLEVKLTVKLNKKKLIELWFNLATSDLQIDEFKASQIAYASIII